VDNPYLIWFAQKIATVVVQVRFRIFKPIWTRWRTWVCSPSCQGTAHWTMMA